MFDLGIQELIVIFVVALLVFGPKRLPELGRSLGKGLAELKKAVQDVKEQMHTELEEEKRAASPEAPKALPGPEAGEAEVTTKEPEGSAHEKTGKDDNAG
jgi:TatA/E family protein of Tat protein translocase